MSGNDPEAFRDRIRQIGEMFASIADQAREMSRDRCPYRDRLDLCTARFRCRNQRPAPAGAERALACGHDGRFDYRSAWEMRPETYEMTRAKLRRIREEAAARRAAAAPEDGG